MKRRRNSDDNIRKLERRAFGVDGKGGTPDEIAAYWKACIRAGVTPKHNIEWHPDRVVWTLYPDGYKNLEAKPEEQLRRVVRDNTDIAFIWYNSRLGHAQWQDCDSVNEALTLLLDGWEKQFDEGGHQKYENPDDLIRKLERKAFSTLEKEDLANYWRACLRSSEIPKPNLICWGFEKLDEYGYYAAKTEWRLPEDPPRGTENEVVTSLGWSLYWDVMKHDLELPRVMTPVRPVSSSNIGLKDGIYLWNKNGKNQHYPTYSKELHAAYLEKLLEVY